MLAPPHFKLMAPCAASALTACLSLSYLFHSHHELCDTASAALLRSPFLTRCFAAAAAVTATARVIES